MRNFICSLLFTLIALNCLSQEKEIKKIDKQISKGDFNKAFELCKKLKDEVANKCYYHLAQKAIENKKEYYIDKCRKALEGYDPDSIISGYYTKKADQIYKECPVDALNLYQKAGKYKEGGRKVAMLYLEQKKYGYAKSQFESIGGELNDYLLVAETAFKNGEDNYNVGRMFDDAQEEVYKSATFAEYEKKLARKYETSGNSQYPEESAKKGYNYAISSYNEVKKVYETLAWKDSLELVSRNIEKLNNKINAIDSILTKREKIKNASAQIKDAIGANNLEQLEKALKYIDIDNCNKNGYSALHYAVEAKNIKCIEYLLANGADINNHLKNKNTPLHLAIKQNNIQLVRYLLSKGAQLHIYALYSGLPSDIAYNKEYKEILNILLPKSNSAKQIQYYRLFRNKFFKKQYYSASSIWTQCVQECNGLYPVISAYVSNELKQKYKGIQSKLDDVVAKKDYQYDSNERIALFDKMLVEYAGKTKNKADLKALCYFTSGSTNATYLLEGLKGNLVKNPNTPKNFLEKVEFK